MALSIETLAVAKKYTDDSIAGGGALKGKNCVITSIASITGGHRVTFQWTLDNGTVQTDTMDVMDGADGQDGEDGKGIQSVSVNAENHLIITYTDGTTVDAGQIEIHSAVDSVNGQTGAVVLDAEDVGALPDDTPIPSKTSDLTNDSGFITKAVNDLVNYYLKSDTYSKTEVDDIVTAIKNSRFEVVATLPTTDIKTNVIYLVPKSPSQTSNVKDEYINLDGTTAGWEKIGDTEIDLSDYVTTQALNTALAAYTTTADLTTLLAGKQDTLTFDNVPTENSNNPVKSGGVFTSEQDIFEVMGQNGAKNLIPYPYAETTKTQNGVTFTDNGDGTITVNGTASANTLFTISTVLADVLLNDNTTEYILSGCEGGGGATYKLVVDDISDYSIICNQFDNEADFTIASSHHGIRASIVVYSGQVMSNVIFKPMVRLASDTDSTYQPYAKTNQELTQKTTALDENVKNNGAVNMLSNIATTKTINGITFTVNADGSVTADGTASATTELVIAVATPDNPLIGKKVRLTGCPKGGNNNDTYSIQAYRMGSTDGSEGSTSDFGDGVVFDWKNNASGTVGNIKLIIRNGYVANNLVFKPMVSYPSFDLTYDDFIPYAKTNRELTAENQTLTNQANDMVNVLGAKNLIPYPYHRQNGYTTNGATFTYDDEGVITVNKVVGNSTAYFGLFSNILYPNAEKFLKPNTSYILSMELENATNTSCFVQTQTGIDIAAIRNKATGKYEISFTTTETIDSLAVALYYGAEKTENNAKVKLMIRLASIQDDTWVPYVPTNKELMSCKLNGYVGAKNLLAYPYKHTTKSENGVTFTDNGDGTITVNTPTSASAETTFYLSQSIQSILDTGMYILSGCPSGGNRTSGYFMEFAELATSSSDWKMFGTDTGEGAIAHIDSTRYAIHAYIRIRSGATVSNLTFKPMIRRVEDTDPTWQPYAKTNRELTEKIDIVGNLFTTTTKVVDNITHGIATTIATLENLPIGTYVVSGQFNSDSAMSGGGLIQFASSGVIQNGASCNPIINQGFKANAGLTGIFNVTNATNQINLQIYTATADLTVSSARLAAIRIA